MKQRSVDTVSVMSPMHLLRRVAPTVVMAGLLLPTVAPGQTTHPTAGQAVVVRTLENGVTAIIQPLRTAPVVSVRAYVRAGGLYEGRWLGCGISHITEHLMAQEAIHETPGGGGPHSYTEKRSRTLEIGGQSNAYTSLDHTCYYISASSSKTAECIDLIADQVTEATFTEEDFQREHGVVQRELEMGKDDPSRQMWYAHMANVFSTHPAAVPVIGYASPLGGLTYEDVRAYVEQMYVPQHTVVAVSGDVDVPAVLELIEEHFGQTPEARVPELALPEVPAITGVRQRTVENPNVSDVQERISFQTIPLVHPDLYALDVLSYVLSQGRSSRLVQDLQYDRRLVTSIDTSSWTPAWGKGVFTIAFRAEPAQADAARRAVFEELMRVRREGVSGEELARAKRQKLADLVYSRQTAESIAGALATDCLSAGDVQFSENYTRRIQEVTGEEVLRVAREYLTPEDVVITRMVPAGTVESAGPPLPTASETEASVFTLDNGLRVVLHPTDQVGLVSMALVARGGVLLEDEETNGLGSLMAALSTRGAGGRSAEEIAAFFDEAGGKLNGSCGNNTFYWQASVLADRFAGAMEIFADVIVRPDFPADELESLKPIQKARIEQIEEHWQSQLMRFFRERFFAGSPYALQPIGRQAVVDEADTDDLAAWHGEYVRGGSSVLAVFGRFDPADARLAIETGFADLPAGAVTVPEAVVRRPEVPAGGSRTIETTRNVQAGLIVAVPGMTVENLDDRLPINVLDTIMSGYHLPSGWLHSELRGRQLVYVVHAYNWPGEVPGAFLTYAACQPENAPEVLRVIREKYARAADYTPAREEVDRAVNVILTADALADQTMSALAMGAALDELYGLGYDFRMRAPELYRRVTPEDVRRVGEKYFSGPSGAFVTTPQPEVFSRQSGTQPAEPQPQP